MKLIKRLSPNYIIVTLHRRENFGQKLKQQIQAIEQLVDLYPEINFLLPVHNNPNVQKALFKLPDKKNIFLEKTNKFHLQIEERKKNTELKIVRMKSNALNDIKNASIKIGIEAVESLMKNSIDKNKIENIYNKSIEQTITELKKIKA